MGRVAVWRSSLVVLGLAAAVLLPAPARADDPPASWSYDRPAQYEAVKTPVLAPTRETGVLLGCDLYRPGLGGQPVPGRFPGIVAEFTPYFALRAAGLFDPQAGYLAAHGYNVVVCNVRGTGDSGGVWTQASSPEEARDNYDLVEWLAAQPWSDGRVGQEGFSYGGFTTYRVAALRPPHLVAIAPQQSQSNLYLDDPYKGGIWSNSQWPVIASALSGGRVNAAAEIALWRSHPTLDAFWKQIAISTKFRDIRVPVLAIGGWDDMFFRAAMVENYRGLRSQTWIAYGPWPHTNAYAFPGCGSGCAPDTAPVPPGALLAWWDRWLKRLAAPLPSTRFVSYENPVGAGRGWEQLRDWPPPDVSSMRLNLTSDGGLQRAAARTGSASFSQPGSPALPGNSLSFTTAPFTGDRVLAGSVRLQLRATLTAADANFHVQLHDVAPDGSSTLVNDGYLRASHRLSHEQPSPVVPGQPTSFAVDVWPDHWRFVEGHRLRLTVSGGDPAALEPPPAPVTVSVATGEQGSYANVPFRR